MFINFRPVTYIMGSNINLGSFGVTGVKRSLSAKMLLLLQKTWYYLHYVTWCIHVTHKYAWTWLSIAFFVSRSTWGHFRRQDMPSVMANVSSFFFLLSSSGNTSFSHTSLHRILTKLGQSDQYLDHYSGTSDDGVRGHDGVTGVKKVISPKRHQVLQIT